MGKQIRLQKLGITAIDDGIWTFLSPPVWIKDWDFGKVGFFFSVLHWFVHELTRNISQRIFVWEEFVGEIEFGLFCNEMDLVLNTLA